MDFYTEAENSSTLEEYKEKLSAESTKLNYAVNALRETTDLSQEDKRSLISPITERIDDIERLQKAESWDELNQIVAEVI